MSSYSCYGSLVANCELILGSESPVDILFINDEVPPRLLRHMRCGYRILDLEKPPFNLPFLMGILQGRRYIRRAASEFYISLKRDLLL